MQESLNHSPVTLSQEATMPPEKLKEKSGNDWQLIYTGEISKLNKEKPRIIKNVLQLISEVERTGVGERMERDGIAVTFFQERNWSHNFKVEVGGETFFVRKERGRGTGLEAMHAFEEAKERIRERNDIRLIDHQLGYADNVENDYFVAKWEDLPIMADYLGQDLSDEERSFIAEKLMWIYETFADYKDVTTGNMFYDPKNKQVVLFDLQKSDPAETDKER
ncbi:hypothetical protein L0Y46_04160 [bacterium]|nr:hypothetical protein [bacterium]MCI0680120.1 hypothetical protein [bacterium]